MEIIMYGTSWCPDCIRSRRLLQSRSLTFQEIDIEEIEGARAAMHEANGGTNKIPTIVIGTDFVMEPSDDELSDFLIAHRRAS